MKLTKSILRLGALAGLGLLLTSAGHAQAKFKIGQSAPEFKAGRWVKGGPITRLEPGQIYVMEFWATWCGPCIAAMPHLSELARQHAGKVTMIGVNILEHSSGEKAERNVDRLIEQKGKDADYPICRDTADDYLKKQWFDPTRSPGIPTTLVVDAQGRIAWIGHPKDVEQVLNELLAGRFDYEKAAAEYIKKSSGNEAMIKVFNEYGEAMKAKDWARAVAVVDNNSQYAATMWLFRFTALLHLDSSQALAQAKEAVTKKEREASSFLMAIGNADDLPKELYQYAATELERDPSPMNCFTLAKLAYHLGDGAKAVEYQLKFKDFMLKMDPKPTQETLDKIEADLLKYQGKS